MLRVWIVVGVLALVFWVFSIVDCAMQPATRHRGVSKPIWMLIVIFLPVFGGVLWFVIGRRTLNDMLAPAGPAPDDDPEFLRGINRAEQDARIKRLEEELKQLDDETDPPGKQP